MYVEDVALTLTYSLINSPMSTCALSHALNGDIDLVEHFRLDFSQIYSFKQESCHKNYIFSHLFNSLQVGYSVRCRLHGLM